jgi:hypothetical protein
MRPFIDEQPTLKIKAHTSRRLRRTTKRRWCVFLSVLLLIVISGSILSVVGYNRYHGMYQRDTSLARLGMQHIQRVDTLLLTLSHSPFDAQVVAQIQQELMRARTNFAQLQRDMASLPPGTMAIPVYGARIGAVVHVLAMTQSLIQAGLTGCSILNLLIARLHDPLNPHAQGITPADLSTISRELQSIQTDLANADIQLAQVQPGDVQFNAQLSKAVAELHTFMPEALTWLQTIEQALPVLPTLLGVGTPTNYLIEVLDSTELRPGGGFIGNYGYATLSGGRLVDAHITDVDLLDRPFEAAGNTIAVPAQYKWFNEILGPGGWSLRDSDLDADFPTSAHYALTNYKLEGGTPSVQGVIAITPTFMQQIMQITGPIAVPEYGDTVTAQNLIALIHYHQLGGPAAGEGSDLIPSPDGYSSLRKRFTAILAQNLLTRVRQLAPTEAAKFMQVLINGVRTKDVQLYFTAPAAEKLLTLAQVDDTIRSPSGDSLMVVDANLSPNKANSFITSTINDQVTINTQGQVMHHMTLTYAWTLPGQNYGNPIYRDYVQVYVPPESQLQAQQGWQPYGTTSAHGRKVFTGFFTLTFGETHSITLDWLETGVVAHDRNGWHYQYLLQRQAGILRAVQVHITLPVCASGIVFSRPMLQEHQKTLVLNEDLTQDTTLAVQYDCKR